MNRLLSTFAVAILEFLLNYKINVSGTAGNNLNNLISGIVNYFMSDLVKLMCGIVK